jgi:glucose 1-dehydrogenase
LRRRHRSRVGHRRRGRPPAARRRRRGVLADARGDVSTGTTPIDDLAAEAGGFDVVIEATGDAQVMAGTLSLLGRNGVACLLGIDGRPREVAIDGRVLAVDTILQNRALFGSVNAHRTDWDAAVEHLDRARRRWPEALERFVGRRVAPEDFADAFAFSGVKATLQLGDAPR